MQNQNSYNHKILTIAKVKHALTPQRLEIFDTFLAWVGIPAFIALSTELTKRLNQTNTALQTLDPQQGVNPEQINQIHDGLVAAQFVYLGMAITRLAMKYRFESKQFHQYMLDHDVYNEQQLRVYQRSPRQFLRKFFQAAEIAGVVASGCYLASPQYSLYAGFGLIASTGVAGNLADYILKQARMMFAKRVLANEFVDLDGAYRELAKGFAWKFFGIFTIPAVVLLIANKASPIANQRDPDGEIALLPSVMDAVAFGLISTACSFPGVMSRMLGAKYEAQMIENVDGFEGTRPDVVTRPSFEFGRVETNAGVMDGIRYKLALLCVALTSAIVSSIELDSPFAMLAISLVAFEFYALLQWQASQDADRIERLKYQVRAVPLPGVGPGFFTQCGSAITRCLNRAEGGNEAGERQQLLPENNGVNVNRS